MFGILLYIIHLSISVENQCNNTHVHNVGLQLEVQITNSDLIINHLGSKYILITYGYIVNIVNVIHSTDTTETGYALGHPDQRETIPSSERTLSPAACAIVRVLMHASLLWASCNNEVYN